MGDEKERMLWCKECETDKPYNLFIGTQRILVKLCRDCKKDNIEIGYNILCKKCKEIKPIYEHISLNDKLLKKCKTCSGIKDIVEDIHSRRCTKCNKVKYLHDFTDDNTECDKCIKLKEKISIKNAAKTNKYKKMLADPSLVPPGQRLCSGCEVPHDISAFTFPDGTITDTNQCVKKLMYGKNYDSTKRGPGTEKYAERLKQNREKKYYLKYRINKRLADEEAYKQHNDRIARIWRGRKREHLKKYRMNNINFKLDAAIRSASKKGYEWGFDREAAVNMMLARCFYCNMEYDGLCVHGITRLDTTLGFTPENCVTSCKYCTMMKKALDANTFIQRCRYIERANSDEGVEYNEELWRDSNRVSYDKYKSRADKKGLEFILSNDEFNTICNNSCAYCGRENSDTHTNGIDRKDNTKGYIADNCVAACFECNIMKGELSYGEYISRCISIATNPNLPATVEGVTRCLTSNDKPDLLEFIFTEDDKFDDEIEQEEIN